MLENPAWPLTNNEAERTLRYWVIMRKITQGTNSEQGVMPWHYLPVVFATCRLRKNSPLLYLSDMIKMRRQGNDVPKLPQVPALVAA